MNNRSHLTAKLSFLTPLFLFISACVVRFWFLLSYSESVFIKTSRVDVDLYINSAISLVRSGWFPSEPFFTNPLVIYILAILYRFGGEWVKHYYLLQVFLGSLTCLLLYVLGRRISGPLAGWIACILGICYAPLIVGTCFITGEVIAIFFNLLSFWFLLNCQETAEKYLLIVAGVLFGISSLARTHFLGLVPLVGFWVYKHFRLKGLLMYLLGVFLAISPVTYANYRAADDFIPVTSNAGINFYIGNHPQATGIYTQPLNISDRAKEQNRDSTHIAERVMGHKLKPSQVSAFWFKKGLATSWHHPGRFIGNLVKKALLSLNVREFSLNLNYEEIRADIKMLKFFPVNFGILAPLGIWGLWILRKKPVGGILGLLIGGYLLILTIFYIALRYRLPVAPYFILAAAVACEEIYNMGRERSWSRVGKAAPVLVLGVIIVFWPVTVPPNIWASKFRGIKYSALGDYEHAIVEFKKQLTQTPQDHETLVNLGVSHFNSGKLNQAESYFHKAIEARPERIAAYFNLGAIYHRLGNYDMAEEVLQKGLAHEAGHLASLFLLARIYQATDREMKAVDLLKILQQIEPDNVKINELLTELLDKK